MNEYTASNGVKVSIDDDHVHFKGTRITSPVWFRDGELQALREFFRDERDEELGRWRSDADPNWTAVLVEDVKVVEFRHDDGVHTFNVHAESKDMSSWTPALQAIGREYFAAHPAPKPWQDAKPGEVWSITGPRIDGEAPKGPDGGAIALCFEDTSGGRAESDLFFVYGDGGASDHVEISDKVITSAHRIYPPADPS